MNVHELFEADQKNPKRVAVVGDTMLDAWEMCDSFISQDDCPSARLITKSLSHGGAAGVARQFDNWATEAHLLGPINEELGELASDIRFYPPFFMCGTIPTKTRFLTHNGKILFRMDEEPKNYDLPKQLMEACRERALELLRRKDWDMILLVDYEKGFLSDNFIQEAIAIGRQRRIPVIADPKRHPSSFRDSILKVNKAYFDKYSWAFGLIDAYAVVTRGGALPFLSGFPSDDVPENLENYHEVVCKNHVGAGDCFLSHLALGMLHGMYPDEASLFAHHAGRVYVQHLYGRPPYPHEIARDYDPVAGKLVTGRLLASLGNSLHGHRVVFANGVFRLPHAGHAWLLEQARKLGDVLIVGINDDASAARQRPGEVVLPLDERVRMLAGYSFVDWIVPFAEDTPEAIMKVLKPAVLAKGNEYQGQRVPGDDLAEVVFLGPSPYPQHATTLIEGFRKGYECR